MSLKKPSASETRSEIREKNELGNSYAERLVHKIERHLEEKPEKLLLTKAGRLSLQGRKIADDQLSELLGECDNDYEEALSVLREIERSATLQGDVPHKDEVLKIVRCMRGKLVYRAHLTYVLDHYADEIPSGVRINAFAFLKEKGNPHKSSPEQSVYRAATYISKYRPQSTQKLYGFEEGEQLQERASAVEESLLEFRGEVGRRANELAQQNSAIIEGDTGRGSEAGRWEIIRRRFMRFTGSLKQKLRTAVQVGLVLAVVSTSISASSASLSKEELFLKSQIQTTSPELDYEDYNNKAFVSEMFETALPSSISSSGMEAGPDKRSMEEGLGSSLEDVTKTGSNKRYPYAVGDKSHHMGIEPTMKDERTPMVGMIGRDAGHRLGAILYNTEQEPKQGAKIVGETKGEDLSIDLKGSVLNGRVGENGNNATLPIFRKYLAVTPEAAAELALKLDFIGPDSPYEHPSNMCGPLSASILKDLLPSNIASRINIRSFWLANPYRLSRLLSRENFDLFVLNTSVDKADFEWRLGDFIYLQGGDFDHMITVSRVDKYGRVYGITNIKGPDGKFVVDELLLYDPNDPEIGLFNKYPNGDLGYTTGTENVYVWRYKALIDDIAPEHSVES